MACFYPKQAFLVSNGIKKIIKFGKKYSDCEEVKVSCGQCRGCGLERSRQWGVRCMHEAQMHEKNCFITLTYSNEHLPKDFSLHIDVMQDFLKRLRKMFVPQVPKGVLGEARKEFLDKYGIRTFYVGEYGGKYGRPHYHALLFNCDFPDKHLWKTRNGIRLYVSEMLQQLWPYGFSTIGDVTFQSASYCSRYCLKKVNGDQKKSHYKIVNPLTGLVVERTQEFSKSSLKPAVASDWFNKYWKDVYPSDEVIYYSFNREILKGKPPRFYDKLLEKRDPDLFVFVKKSRKDWSLLNPVVEDRLRAKEKITLKKMEPFLREVEDQSLPGDPKTYIFKEKDVWANFT